MSEQTNTPRRSLYPWFRYSDAPAAIDWLVKVLGFSVHARFDGPGGTVAHELEHSGGMLLLGSARRDPGGVFWGVGSYRP